MPDIPVEQISENKVSVYEQLNLFGEVFERVREQYVEEVGDDKLIEYALNGMLTSLDPHSSYLTEDDFEDMRVQTKGEFGGLGIEVTMENGFVKVVSPIDDTPAAEAGIEAGDYITHLDGDPVMGMTLSEAVDQMRGKVGTPIELTVRRENVAEPLIINITRDIIQIKSVKFRVLADNIGYIRITTFNQNTFEGLEEAIETIEEDIGDNLLGYVLDVRNNPGGLLDQAIYVADAFLERGEIVSTRGRDGADSKRDNATPGDMIDGLPIVVLINGGSASASEIVAGALQDHRRGILLGTKTFGKGSVQTLIPLPGHGAMRLTTARYYTPSGRSIQAKGVEPDIEVEPARIERLQTLGISEADLKGALDKVIEEKSGEPQDPLTKSDDSEEDKKLTREEEQAKRDAEDYQLNRALDILKGLAIYDGRAPFTMDTDGEEEEEDSAAANDNEEQEEDGEDE